MRAENADLAHLVCKQEEGRSSLGDEVVVANADGGVETCLIRI